MAAAGRLQAAGALLGSIVVLAFRLRTDMEDPGVLGRRVDQRVNAFIAIGCPVLVLLRIGNPMV